MAFCAGCGAQMADGATVCAACGKGQSVGGGAAAAPATSAQSGLNDNVAGLLSYLFIPAIIFLVVEPFNKNKFVRFHAFQGLFLGGVSIVGHIVLTIIPIIGWIILPFFSLAIFVIAVIAAIKAYGNNKWMIPIIGPMAEKQADAM
jgi:uncharacterized membrane protein